MYYKFDNRPPERDLFTTFLLCTGGALLTAIGLAQAQNGGTLQIVFGSFIVLVGALCLVTGSA